MKNESCPFVLAGEELQQLPIDSSAHFQHYCVVAQFRNVYLDLSGEHPAVLPEQSVYGDQLHCARNACDAAGDVHCFLQLLVVDVLDDEGCSGTDVVVGAECAGDLVDFALALGQIHAGQLDHLVAVGSILPLYDERMLPPHQQR